MMEVGLEFLRTHTAMVAYHGTTRKPRLLGVSTAPGSNLTTVFSPSCSTATEPCQPADCAARNALSKSSVEGTPRRRLRCDLVAVIIRLRSLQHAWPGSSRKSLQ